MSWKFFSDKKLSSYIQRKSALLSSLYSTKCTMKCIPRFSIIFILSNFVVESEEYKILGIFPNQERSDNIFSQALMKILLKSGHHVDLISNFELENNFESANYSRIFNLTEIFNFDSSWLLTDPNFIKDPVWFLSERGNYFCNLMAHEKMQELFAELKKNSKYDVIIIETFEANCYIGLGHFLKVPVIKISNNLRFPWTEESIGNPKSTAYIPNYLSGLTEINNFWDRLKNSFSTLIQKYRYYIYIQKQTEIMRNYLRLDIPDIREVEESVALTLVNSHYSLEGIRPLTSAFIEVGGLHIFEDETHLRMDLKKWMDESSHGVVYFNLGLELTIEALPKKVINILFASFAKINPVRVLMRVKDAKKLPLEIPRNIKILKSIPQIPVLAHQNTKVLTMLGRISEIQEAVHFGIPVIGIPISFDQILNIEYLVEKKVSIRINLKDLSERKMNDALTLILKDHMYRDSANNLSHFFRDRPLNAKKTALYWIEYILKNRPESLKSPAVFLSWYQIELLDVYLFLLFTTFLVLYLTIFIARKFVHKVRNYTTPCIKED